MPLPRIRYCLVCDQIRQEVGKKITLLGFYGILPNVTLLLPNFEAPLDRLTFIFLVENANVRFELGFKVEDAEQKVLFSVPTMKPALVVQKGLRDEVNGTIVLTVGNVGFKSAGKYTVQVSGDLKFQDQFEVALGVPEDFQ